MTDLEARDACKTILALAATNLREGKAALRKVRDFVNGLALDEETATAAPRKFSGARDRMERAASNRDET